MFNVTSVCLAPPAKGITSTVSKQSVSNIASSLGTLHPLRGATFVCLSERVCVCTYIGVSITIQWNVFVMWYCTLCKILVGCWFHRWLKSAVLLGFRLCVSVLAVDRFGDSPEAAYGIFDGDRNEEISRLLQCTMGDVLAEEIQHSSVDSVYMCNTFLTSHRCVLHTHTHTSWFD